MERLDVFLVNNGYYQSREKASQAIKKGIIEVDGKVVTKPSFSTSESNQIKVLEVMLPYVSWGGMKLERAIKYFNLDFTGKTVMDIGASTGGFTDCMLQNGASKVYAVDVGYGQFAWKLRQDERVVCMEKTNIRYVLPEHIEEPVEFASIDVSFISLTKVLLSVSAKRVISAVLAIGLWTLSVIPSTVAPTRFANARISKVMREYLGKVIPSTTSPFLTLKSWS